MSNFTDFISGGSASFPTIFLSKSQTWVPPQDGNIMIHVIGAGGSGAGYNNTSATSGAAGGYCRKNSIAVTTSGSFTVVVGAGGASVKNSNGITGGNTTVAGTGLSSTLTANGGSRGLENSTGTSAGGTASGGDVNNTGGGGGHGIGGGAVGLIGTGNAGTQLSGFMYQGGDCDVMGDLWSSSLGQIAGGRGGDGAYQNNYAGINVVNDAQPLGGGGTHYSTSLTVVTAGGHASIGGGGGACINLAGGSYTCSGRGGEGIVLLQYIP